MLSRKFFLENFLSETAVHFYLHLCFLTAVIVNLYQIFLFYFCLLFIVRKRIFFVAAPLNFVGLIMQGVVYAKKDKAKKNTYKFIRIV